MTESDFARFDKDLAKGIRKRVFWDDREVIRIPASTKDTPAAVKKWLKAWKGEPDGAAEAHRADSHAFWKAWR